MPFLFNILDLQPMFRVEHCTQSLNKAHTLNTFECLPLLYQTARCYTRLGSSQPMIILSTVFYLSESQKQQKEKDFCFMFFVLTVLLSFFVLSVAYILLLILPRIARHVPYILHDLETLIYGLFPYAKFHVHFSLFIQLFIYLCFYSVMYFCMYVCVNVCIYLFLSIYLFYLCL